MFYNDKAYSCINSMYILYYINGLVHKRRNGKEGLIKFSEWTLTEEMVGSVQYGECSLNNT